MLPKSREVFADDEALLELLLTAAAVVGLGRPITGEKVDEEEESVGEARLEWFEVAPVTEAEVGKEEMTLPRGWPTG